MGRSNERIDRRQARQETTSFQWREKLARVGKKSRASGPPRASMANYRRNHYVPEWFQHSFLLPGSAEQKFYYLDLHPEVRVSPGGRRYIRNSILRWGPQNCFYQDDLYTAKLGSWESTEIEQRFFGKVDSSAQSAVEYFATFEHPSADGEAFQRLPSYMSVQKLRTPKGLAYLAASANLNDKNQTLMALQQLQNL